ncbi:MAG: antiterminator LoaP [Treponemataceae bacterium]|nr:MAG: antiterminator LoaP [Treponemataceae bacterium]
MPPLPRHAHTCYARRMEYYVLQVKTAYEDKYLSGIEQKLLFRAEKQRFFLPKRKLSIRRGGKIIVEERPIFGGYVFLQTDVIDREIFDIARKTPYFSKFLHSNQNIVPLREKDFEIIRHFDKFGTADVSKVVFDENDKIVVLEGPLKGLEGYIIKVNKRKGRAKIRLPFSNENFLLDLGFNAIKPLEKTGTP